MTMAPWLLFLLLLSFPLIFALKLITSHKNKRLPPGPPTLLFLAKFLYLRRSIFDIEDILRQLHAVYGPIISLGITSPPTIFIADRRIAHHALVQKGSIFSDRPPAVDPDILLSSNQHNVSSSRYGPLWRLLRRNLTSDVLHTSRAAQLAPARKWVLHILKDRLAADAAAGGVTVPVETFQYAMFCLLVFMCFGEKPDETVIRDIEAVERFLLLVLTRFNVFAFLPKITKIVFRKRWNEIVATRKKLEEIFLSFIRTRGEQENSYEYAYVDSLLQIELPEEGGRKLTGGEMVSLCSEFLNAGTDTSTTALQWIMANLVKHQDVQEKLLKEIEEVVRNEAEAVEEEDLQKMPYLKAVIMEGLRRHPPGHFVLPHAAAEEVELEGYVIPKGAAMNFEIAEINWDGGAWEEPMEFRSERFVEGGEGEGEGVDMKGTREIKMMTFGAGRRICPGMGLAMLNLEYFVANLVREFEWKGVAGEEVDMSEKLEFTVVMKNPLRARVVRRWRCIK